MHVLSPEVEMTHESCVVISIHMVERHETAMRVGFVSRA